MENLPVAMSRTLKSPSPEPQDAMEPEVMRAPLHPSASSKTPRDIWKLPACSNSFKGGRSVSCGNSSVCGVLDFSLIVFAGSMTRDAMNDALGVERKSLLGD